MKLKNYLDKIGLLSEKNLDKIESEEVNNYVDNAIDRKYSSISEEEVNKLYSYQVPEIGEDGACGIGVQDEPYDLTDITGLDYSTEELKNHPNTTRLARLNSIVEDVYDDTGVDWIGIYRKTSDGDGEEVLVKEAYRGRISRAEFPLTEEFAERSNNSTVGLTGEAVVVDDVESYEGPYYECDSEVESEFCCPILSSDEEIIGIIDAESFEKNFFDAETVLEIAKVCHDLGESELLKVPQKDTRAEIG